MKSIQTILIVFSLMLMASFANAQGNCPGGKIRVYKGASGCGCHCMKECVTPAELPVYLANGWNTSGCWNCCWFKNWVDADAPKTSLDQVYPNAEPGSLTISFTLATESDVKIQVTDITGRYVATVVDEFREDHVNELIWDESELTPGIYLLTLEAGSSRDTKILSVGN